MNETWIEKALRLSDEYTARVQAEIEEERLARVNGCKVYLAGLLSRYFDFKVDIEAVTYERLLDGCGDVTSTTLNGFTFTYKYFMEGYGLFLSQGKFESEIDISGWQDLGLAIWDIQNQQKPKP